MSDITPQPSTLKTCSKCGETRPLSDFHVDRSVRDGLRAVCKVCASEQRRAYYEANREHVLETNRVWREANAERMVEIRRAWAKANPEKIAENGARMRAKYPDRHAARLAVNYAVRRGRLVPPRDLPCTECGSPANEYHHHLGYAREHRLDVIPVCVECHTELDRG